MSNWIPVTATALGEASIRGLVQKYADEAANLNLPDPSTLVQQSVDEVRACIGFSGKYQVDADTTAIPRGLQPLVVRKIVREMARSLGVTLSNDDKDDAKAYDLRMDKIRQGQWPVEKPDNPILVAPVQTSVVTPSINPRCHRRDAY